MRYAPRTLVEQWTRQKDTFARNVGVTPERSARYRELRRRLIRELHAAGVPIAVGSDAFNLFNVAGFGTFSELETLVAAGLSPQAVLEAATVQVARLLDLDGVPGTVAVGSAADLVLLDASPLTDIANARRQAGVMLRGRWLARADIDRGMEALTGG
jgi:imidazolonepropionase-like amidohydrolase